MDTDSATSTARVSAPPRLLYEARLPYEYLRLRRSQVFAGHEVDGRGLPVVLVPGLLSDDGALAVMQRWLRRTGHRPYRSRLGRNVGCAESAVRRLDDRVDEVACREGRRVALVGHSRGGHFARVVAARRRDAVAGLVTLGTPPMDPRAVHPAAAVATIGLTLLGSLRVPGMMRWSCYTGRCCARFRQEVCAPLAPDVPHVAVYSRSDAVVDWRRVHEPGAEAVEVPASHVGIVVNPHAYAAVAAALHRFGEEAG